MHNVLHLPSLCWGSRRAWFLLDMLLTASVSMLKQQTVSFIRPTRRCASQWKSGLSVGFYSTLFCLNGLTKCMGQNYLPLFLRKAAGKMSPRRSAANLHILFTHRFLMFCESLKIISPSSFCMGTFVIHHCKLGTVASQNHNYYLLSLPLNPIFDWTKAHFV